MKPVFLGNSVKSTLFGITALTAILFSTAQSQAQTLSPAITAAVENETRPEKDRQLDVTRHPADLLAFAKVKQGDMVIDMLPGNGYWSRIFSTITGPEGKVRAFVPAELAGSKSDPVARASAVTKESGHGNVEVSVTPLDQQPPVAMYNKADLVWTFDNYHDLHNSNMKGADVNRLNQAIYKLLKPGAYYVIVDHAAGSGAGLKNTEDLHRIDPATVKAEVEKAGFVLDGESRVLANPDDPHTLKIIDPAIRGKTDQFAFRFRKPAN